MSFIHINAFLVGKPTGKTFMVPKVVAVVDEGMTCRICEDPDYGDTVCNTCDEIATKKFIVSCHKQGDTIEEIAFMLDKDVDFIINTIKNIH
jgi:hypothetical protein